MTSYKEAYKYPFIVTEILSSRNPLIEKPLLTGVEDENNNNMLNLIKVLDNKEVLNSTIPGYINKVITSHLENDLFIDNILKNSNVIYNILLKYIYNDSYRDLFYLIVNAVTKKEKTDNNDIILKLYDCLLNNMNQYISFMNNNPNDNIDKLYEIKDGIYNIIYILVKLAENSDELFGLITRKLSEGELLKNLKNNIKEIDEEGDDEENNINNTQNINAFYCINKLSILFSNLFNIIITKNENDKYSFNKYFLSTIFDPPYSPYNYVPSYVINNANKDNNAEKTEEDNKKKEAEENINLLIDVNISYLKEIYSIFENKIEIINDLNKSVIFSFYNKITDILILIVVIEKKDNEKLHTFLNEILIDLIQLIIDYPFCSIIHNKTLKIFELIIEYNYQSIRTEKIINYLKNYFNEIKIDELITDDGAILNNKKESDNNIYLIKILNLLEKQDNQKIVDFLARTCEGLLEKEKMEPGEYTPKPDEDEIIFKKKEEIHDSEGFIFTPKKVIEDSKKIMKNLKNLDI